MVQGNFLDPIERGGVRPDQNSFDRRTSGYSNPQVGGIPQRETFKSLDGRNWSTKDQEFMANKEYYQKMYNRPQDKINNMNNSNNGFNKI